MSAKYYTISLNKRISKDDNKKYQAYLHIRDRLRVFNSDNLYLKFKTGNIACQNAFYDKLTYHMDIIVWKDESGCYDVITGTILDIPEEVILFNELTKEEAISRQNSLKEDPSSVYAYECSISELTDILSSYNEYYKSLLMNPNSFERKRKR